MGKNNHWKMITWSHEYHLHHLGTVNISKIQDGHQNGRQNE